MVWIARGDPPRPERPDAAAARILEADGIEIVAHEGPLDGWEFRVQDGDEMFRVVTNSKGGAAVCECRWAWVRGGGCGHIAAVKELFRRSRDAEATAAEPGPPRPFALW
jgi:hypothetical protein